MSARAYERLAGLRGVDWYPRHDSLLEYLVDHRYDEAEQVFWFRTWSSYLCAHEFHVLLASLKDGPGVDAIQQLGPTYNAWFDTGVFFIRQGAWAYVGEGPEYWTAAIVGPEHARVEDVPDDGWHTVPPLVRAVRLADDFCLAVDWWNAPTTHVSRWWFDPLSWIDDESAERVRVCDAGRRVWWIDEAGGRRFALSAEDLWGAREAGEERY